MAHRHTYNTSEMFEVDSDQRWNLVHTEDPYLHFVRTNSVESGPNFHPAENRPDNRAHYPTPWNGRLNGYPSVGPINTPHHYQADTSNPSRDSIHPSPRNMFMVPENHVHNPSSNYGVENNFFDLSTGNGRGPYKRKSPGIPPIPERGSTSRYFCPGSSSDVSSSSSELGQNKSNVAVPPSYGLSIGSEPSLRNVRSRPTLDFEPGPFRAHLSANYPHHPGPIDPIQNGSVPFPEWTFVPICRTNVPPNLSHESNHFYSSREMGGYHNDHITNRNSLSQSLHPCTSSNTRGVRSNNHSHRFNPNSRVTMGNNMRMRHVGPSDDGLHCLGENHSTRHQRAFGPLGWHNGDRSGRSRVSSDRYRFLSEEAVGSHDRWTPEGMMIVDRSSFYASRDILDQHRDMRLDVDNMSYEELLALGERIGSVNIGLREDQLTKCMTESVYCSSDQVQEEGSCVICLEEYMHMDDVGTLKSCGHDYHVICIKKWLSMKNTCPICKGPALPDSVRDN